MSQFPSRAGLKFAPPSAFSCDVMERARSVLKENDDHRFGNWAQWLRAFIFAVTGVSAYALLLTIQSGLFLSGLLIAIAAISAFMLIVQLGHDASHGSLSRKPWINNWVVFIVFSIIGVDGTLWRDRHIRLHHHVANLPGTGIDADAVTIMRLVPYKGWRWWHRFQPLLAPFLYASGHFLHVWVDDFFNFALARKEGLKEFLGIHACLQFAIGKLVHLTLFLLVPWFINGPELLLLVSGYLISGMMVGYCFVILVAGTHVSSQAAFPQPNSEGQLPHDWAIHQLVTSIDWAPHSKLAAFLSGGANAHVAHHLFPSYSHRHSSKLSKIVSDAASQHDLPHYVTSFPGMVLGHWRHLVALSKPPT